MKITQLLRYPVKGLSCEFVDQAEILFSGMEGDRLYALMHVAGTARPSRDAVDWHRKHHFANQNDFPLLASVRVEVAPGKQVKVYRGKTLEVRASMKSEAELIKVDVFFTNLLRQAKPSAKAVHPKVDEVYWVGGSNRKYTDRKLGVLTIAGTASLKSLEAELKAPLDIRQFRPNIVVDTQRPWEEFEWVGKTLVQGKTRLSIEERVVRCLNINVHPDTGISTVNVLAHLAKLNKAQFSVLATVAGEGTLRVGEAIHIH